ncbi:MAG: DEAD/DEAH box helicase [Solirubrobacteraceae bacterium]
MPGAGGVALREWQRRALAAMGHWHGGSFLISAAPGAGKTRPALEFARGQLLRGAASRVVIACPTAPLTRQWARAAHGLGLDLAPDSDSPRPPEGFHGVVVTYARIANSPRRWSAGVRENTLVIADEAHHLGEDLVWGSAFSDAFAVASRWLLLSGTPFRSDATAIPGVTYDSEGLAEPDFSYTYADAVSDGVCRPVAFITYDGTLSWRSGEDVIESSFATVLSKREANRRYRTAISTDLPDGLPRILAQADARLRKLRRGTHPDAAGLIVATDSEHARRIAARLREVSGRPPIVVLHQDSRAAAKLDHFTRSSEPWIVAVNMVSEGVDIPRLRVGVYATAAKTPMIFRQVVGRFVRTMPGRALEASWLYVPADQRLRNHAASVEQELRSVLRPRGDGDGAELDSLQRRLTERSGTLDFEPLSADVAAQMTLFGPGLGRPVGTSDGVGQSGASRHLGTANGGADHTAGAAVGSVPTPAQTPQPGRETALFQRRARLRAQRHRLVSDLARRDGESQRAVNAWVNREVAATSVEGSSIVQLQRAVELLERRLAPHRSGGRHG